IPYAERKAGTTVNLEVAEGLARVAVSLHVRSLLHQLENADTADGIITMLSSPEQRMLEKIREKGPILFRDLVRTYARQRKRDHEPALRQLLESGQVRLTDDGLLAAADRTEETA